MLQKKEAERLEGRRKVKMQHHGLFADLLTFLAIFLAINTTKPWPKYDKTYTPPPLAFLLRAWIQSC